MNVKRDDYVVKQTPKGFNIFLKIKKKLKPISTAGYNLTSIQEVEKFIEEDIFLINICMEPTW